MTKQNPPVIVEGYKCNYSTCHDCLQAKCFMDLENTNGHTSLRLRLKNDKKKLTLPFKVDPHIPIRIGYIEDF